MTVVRLSREDYAKLITKPKRSKYHAKQMVVTADGALYEAAVAKAHGIVGERFDSKAEAGRWGALKAMERHGLIRNLERQVSYDLHGVDGSKVCVMRPDFRYLEKRPDGAWVSVVEDRKGGAATVTPVYRLKAKLLRAEYGVEIREVRA